MDEQVSKPDFIPDEHHVLRNVHVAQYKKWRPLTTPNETEFALRPGEDGLSVTWEERCSLRQLFILIGLKRNRNNTDFLNPKEFKIVRFNVGVLRSLGRIIGNLVDVVHNPQPDNDSHSLVLYSDDDEIRIKLCELVGKEDAPLLTIKHELIQQELEERRRAIG